MLFNPQRHYRRYRRAWNVRKYCSSSLPCMGWILTFCAASALAFIIHEIISRLIILVDNTLFYSAEIKDRDSCRAWILCQFQNTPPRFVITDKDGTLDITDGIYFTGFFMGIRTFAIVQNECVQIRAFRWSCTADVFMACARAIIYSSGDLKTEKTQ